jgi:hypothetical protein
MNKMKTGLTATGIALVVIAAFAIGFYQGQLLAVQQEVKYPHMVNVVVTRDGTVVYNYTTHNILVTIGSTYVRNILGFNNVTGQNATKWISLSSDTSPTTSWTKLPNEFTTGGLARALATMTVINSTAFQAQASWTSSTTATITCTGLQWAGEAGSDGNLFAAAAVSSASVISGDNIQVTWTVNTPAG